MYSPEERERIVDHVCEQIAQKRPLYKVLAEDEGMPSSSTFVGWSIADDDVASKVARARERAATAYLDEIIEIADDDNADCYVETRDDGTKYAKIDGEAIQRSKVRIYAREKYAQMIAPRQYGAKLDLTSGGEKLPAPQQTVLVDARIQSLLAVANTRLADLPALSREDLLDD